MKFESKKIDLELYGEKFVVKYPSVGMSQEYGIKSVDASEEKKSELLLDLVEKCGLPKEKALSMYPEHFLQLVEELMGSKKK